MLRHARLFQGLLPLLLRHALLPRAAVRLNQLLDVDLQKKDGNFAPFGAGGREVKLGRFGHHVGRGSEYFRRQGWWLSAEGPKEGRSLKLDLRPSRAPSSS